MNSTFTLDENFLFILIVCGTVWGGIGVIVGNSIYRGKNRNPITGAVVGGLCGFLFGILGLAGFGLIASNLRKLQPGERDYYPDPRGVSGSGHTPHIVAAPPPRTTTEQRLQEAEDLRRRALITEDEYQALRKRILGIDE